MTQIILQIKETEYTFEVVEMTTLDHMHAKRYRDNLIQHPRDDEDEQILLLFFYSIFKHASRGVFPDETAFLLCPAKVSDMWYNAVNDQNPGALPQPEEIGTEEEVLAKKG
jgi:hypothetical protein